MYFRLRTWLGVGWWGIVFAMCAIASGLFPLISFMGYFGTGRLREIVFGASFTWISLVGIVFVFFFLMDMTSLIARILDWLMGTSFKPRFFEPRKCVPATLLLILVFLLYSYYEAWNVKRVDIVIETSKLPDEIDRLRLVHLTDIHFGGLNTAARFLKVMDIVHSAKPDILVMTGDVVDGDMSYWEEKTALLATHGAKYGAFAVTGNHEFYFGIKQAVDFKERAGFTLLRDARADVAGIAILGLDDPTARGRGWERGVVETLPDSLSFPEDKFVLILKHRPQIIDGSAGKFDLQLSGHTHGGQIWPFGYIVKWMYKHEQGLTFIDSSAVYVSNGAGFWGPPLRFLTPPEVTVIDLVKK